MQRRGDGFDDALGVRQNVGIPEAEYAPARTLKFGDSDRIAGICRVLSAIRLDDDTMPSADEVDDERSDRMLPAEFVSDQPSRPQRRPKPSLGIG